MGSLLYRSTYILSDKRAPDVLSERAICSEICPLFTYGIYYLEVNTFSYGVGGGDCSWFLCGAFSVEREIDRD